MMLGNLSVTEMEKRAEVEFSDECKAFMSETRQQEASNIKAGKWHCFDIPFTVLCGDRETAQKIYDFVKDLKFKKVIQIAVCDLG